MDALEGKAAIKRVQAGGMGQQELYQSQQGQMQSPVLGRGNPFKGISIQFWDLQLRKDLEKPERGQRRTLCWLGLEPLTCEKRLWDRS